MADGTTQDAAATDTPAAAEVITSYKGFDANLACRGFQFEVGKEYTHKGEVEACVGGFHACENPLDVLKYYAPVGSRFAVVEQSGKLSRHSGDSKVASERIKVSAEIGLPGIIEASVEWVKRTTKPTSGDSAHSATSGDSAHSATSGYSAHSATSGDYANSATSGYSAHSATSGDYAHSATSGDSAHSATSGDSAHSATSGDYANSATSGDSAHSATSGYYAHSATSGDSAHSATSGYSAHSATSGDYANSATSGYSAHSATSGDYANSATSGYYANAEAKGANAVAANAGNGHARAGTGGAIFLVERDGDRNILAVFASMVGENGIKADTWYALRGGKPVEV